MPKQSPAQREDGQRVKFGVWRMDLCAEDTIRLATRVLQFVFSRGAQINRLPRVAATERPSLIGPLMSTTQAEIISIFCIFRISIHRLAANSAVDEWKRLLIQLGTLFSATCSKRPASRRV